MAKIVIELPDTAHVREVLRSLSVHISDDEKSFFERQARDTGAPAARERYTALADACDAVVRGIDGSLDPDVFGSPRTHEHIVSGRFWDGVRQHRSDTGCGLTEAVEFCQNLREQIEQQAEVA